MLIFLVVVIGVLSYIAIAGFILGVVSQTMVKRCTRCARLGATNCGAHGVMVVMSGVFWPVAGPIYILNKMMTVFYSLGKGLVK